MDFSAIRFQPQRPLLKELSADRLNSILAEIKRNKPLPGRGITVRQTGQGTCIDLATVISRGAAGVAVTTHPFQLSQTTGADPELIYARARYGTVNGGRPTGFSIADDPPYVLELTQTSGVVYLGGTVDPDDFTLSSLWVDEAAVLPTEDDATTYLEIGSYSVTDGTVSFAQAVTTSLAYIRAGYIHLWGAA